MSGQIILDNPTRGMTALLGSCVPATNSDQLFGGVNPGDNSGTTAFNAARMLKQWAADANSMFGQLLPPVGSVWGGAHIDCRDYGVDPTGGVDSSTGINAALVAGIAAHLPVFLSAGTYLIDSPILMNPVGGISKAEFFGAGMGTIDANSPSMSWTRIVCGFTDRPAIAIGSGRFSVVRDMGIFGLNVAPQQSINGGTPGYPTDIQSNYITAGCRNNRYSPYCGISIDGLNLVNPGGSSSNQYPGMTYYNGLPGSAFTRIQNVTISNFVVGIAYGCSGASLNSDDAVFENVSVTYCDSGYAVGQGQADNCEVAYGQIFGCRQGVDGLHYGAQQGAPPALRHVNLGYFYRIFTLSDTFGALVLDNCFAQTIRTMGNFGIGSGGVHTSAVITGGSYQFASLNSYFGIGPAACVMVTFSPTKFIGTTFQQDGNATAFHSFSICGSGDIPCMLDNCTVTGTEVSNIPPSMLTGFDTSQGQLRINNLWSKGVNGGGILISEDYPRGYPLATNGQYTPGGRFPGTYQSRRIPNASLEYVYQPYSSAAGTPAENTVFVVTTCASFVLNTSGAGSLTFLNGSTPLTLQVGDLIMWTLTDPILGTITKPAVRVTSIVSELLFAVTCSLECDPSLYSPTPPTVGQVSIAIDHLQWAPAVALTCTTSSSSPVITAVSPTSILQNGDWVVDSTGAVITFGTRVVSGGGTASVTLNQNPASSGSATLCFGRLYQPTLTAAF